jgi:hypothetical protein
MFILSIFEKKLRQRAKLLSGIHLGEYSGFFAELQDIS